MTLNKISEEVSQETEDQANQHMDGLIAAFPFLVDLMPDTRKRLAKLSRRRQELLDKIEIYAGQYPHFVPQYTSLTEYLKDTTLIACLQRMEARVNVFHEMLKDTIMALQAEAYETARAFYNTVKEAAKHGVPGAEEILEDLSYHFKRKSSPAKKESDAGSPETNPTETPQ